MLIGGMAGGWGASDHYLSSIFSFFFDIGMSPQGRRVHDDRTSLSGSSDSISERASSRARRKMSILQKCLFHQFVHSPANIQTPQITVVLTHAQKHHGNASGVHHADERADHVAHCVALGDDEAVHADAVVAELAL